MKLILLNLIILTFYTQAFSQTIINPVINTKSHPTLNIKKIEKTDAFTIFTMNIKNELDAGGWFCVDKDVFISLPGKSIKYNIIKVEGIANCPEMHKFSSIGENIDFKLYFPPISDTIKELDLVENCTQNCFFVRGIILDEELTNEIHSFDIGVNHYRKGEKELALSYFIDIIAKSKHTNSKHYAYSMYIIPVIYHDFGKKQAAIKAYKALIKSNIIQKEYFIDKIKEINFFKYL